MSDLIDRQAAINALKNLPTWWADSGGYYGGAQPPMEALIEPDDAINAIDNLPSVEPKQGKWIYSEVKRLVDETDDGPVYSMERKWSCSCCGFNRGFMASAPSEKYCPECGARMVGNETD